MTSIYVVKTGHPLARGVQWWRTGRGERSRAGGLARRDAVPQEAPSAWAPASPAQRP